MAVEEISAADWEGKVLETERLTIVEFWHDRCKWCIKLAPVYKEVSGKFSDVKFLKFNVLSSPANNTLASSKGILSTPTLKFFCGGIEVGEVIGFKDAEALGKEIERVKAEAKTCQENSTKVEE